MAIKCKLDIKEGLIESVVEKFTTLNVKKTTPNSIFVPKSVFSRQGQDYQVAESILKRAHNLYGGSMGYRIAHIDGQQIVFAPSMTVIDEFYETYLSQISPTKTPLFDKGLAQTIQDKFEELYPEIQLTYTNETIDEINSPDIFNQELLNKHQIRKLLEPFRKAEYAREILKEKFE